MTSAPTMVPSPQSRSRRGRLTDRALSRLMGLSRATCDYSVTRGIRIPMRDGVELVADHYAPVSPAVATLLVRGPYGRTVPYSVVFARTYAERGYHVVVQSCRGTFGSGDEFQPMVREAEDGADTVAWLREQLWFEGRFATVGLSYLGFTQWALMTDPPPELAAAVVSVGPHDFSRAAYGTGAFSLNDFLGWSDTVAHQEEGGPLRGLIRLATGTKRLTPALNAVPLLDAGEALLAGRAPWYRGWVTHPDRTDPFWAGMRLDEALDRVSVPVLLIGGWQDLFLDQSLAQYAHLRNRGVEVALTVGPWTHLEMLTKGAGIVTRETLDWLADHLAGTGRRDRMSPVHVFVTGADQWRDLATWPPKAADQVLYLHPGGALGAEPPAADVAPSTFTYDPADPTPTVGGRLLSAAAGYRDNRELEARSDVLTFTGPVLTEDLEVFGVPVVELAHASDNPHADVFVRICEVNAQDRSVNVSDAFVRLDPAAGEPLLRLELDGIAHRFRAGSRIRLQVSGGCHPRFDRNLGTGEDPATSTRMVPSRRTVSHGAGRTSRVVLPVLAP
jgi:putative CocE/NonD family hydrolase